MRFRPMSRVRVCEFGLGVGGCVCIYKQGELLVKKAKERKKRGAGDLGLSAGGGCGVRHGGRKRI